MLRYYRRKPHDFDVAGLTDFIWLHKLQANVKIVRTTMAPHDNRHQEYTRFRVSEPFSQLLKALYTGELNLKKYRRMIGAIALYETTQHGSLLFWTTSEHEHAPRMARHVCPDTALPFSRTEGMRPNQPSDPRICFAGLPKYLQPKLFQYLETDSILFTLDLSSTASFKTTAWYIYTNTALRTHFLRHLTEGAFHVKMSTTSNVQEFLFASKLKRLLNTRIDRPLGTLNGRWVFGAAARYKVVLDFNLDKSTQLDGLRISLVPFIVATFETWNQLEVKIVLKSPDSMPKEETIKLGLLRSKVMAALLTQQDQLEVGNTNELCPDVWVDGLWQVVEVVTKGLAPSEADNVDDGRLYKLGSDDWVPTPPPYPSDGRLQSTIRYLDWIIRIRQKTHDAQECRTSPYNFH
jgi:hypothetical protein